MRRLYDLECKACGTIVERLIELDEVPEIPCPRCGEKKMKRKFSTFSTGGARCDIRSIHQRGG